MAADLNPDWLSCLPSSWSYGVARDGRIFFINEEAKSTTWLHPVTGEAVITGHRTTPDLPTGWEEGYTFEGARCFINHNERKVTCKHPVSGLPSQDNCIFVVNEHVTSAKLVHPVTDPVTVNPVTVHPVTDPVTVNPVTHPVTDPVSNRPKAPEQAPSEESDRVKKERPMSTMSQASNYTGGSDYSTYPGSSPATRPSRSYKKVHNFGKRSNSIKRNPNAPAVKSNWLYKQDSTGMKLWKKRWFVLSDMCLFYYRDEKEEGILGSILLPSFHISMLSVDDHVSRKYAFKATHSNMRTYYFCTDTAKDMESWMKVMTDAALVHTEPIRRLDKLKVDCCCPQEVNNILNHNRVLTRPEIQNNERNLEPRQPSITRSMDRTDGDRKHKDPEKHTLQRERDRYTLQRDGERYSLQKDGVSYTLQRDGERYLLQKDGERYALQKDGERYSLQKDGGERYSVPKDVQMEKYAPQKDGEKYLVQKDGERYALQKEGERYTLQKDGQKYNLQRGVERQTSMTEKDRSDRYGTLGERQKYKTLREGSKCGTLRDGEKHGTLDKYGTLREVDKYGTLREGNKYGFQRDGSAERPLTKINSIKLQPAQAAAIAAAVTASRQIQVSQHMAPHQVNGSGERAGDQSPGEVVGTLGRGAGKAHDPPQNQTQNQQAQEPEKSLTRTNSMRQLENWVRTQRTQEDDDTRSITSYQTLPRNMPSHRAQIVPRYPEGYRTLPRNMLSRPESICSVAGSIYDRALAPTSNADKRRSMRDDTMWQLYEWQQRQAFSRQGPPPPGHYGTLPSPKTMGNISEHQGVAPSIPTSPSHGSLALYHTFSPPGQHRRDKPPGSTRSEVSSPVFRGDQTMTIDCRHRTHLTKYNYPPDRRSMPAGIPVQTITPQSLQGKTPEELTLLLIKLRRQQAELNSIREHTVAQLMILSMEGPNAKSEVLSHHLQRNLVYLDSQTKDNEPLIFTIHTMIENSAPRPQLYQQISPEDYKDNSYSHQRPEDIDIDTKLSRLCEQDQVVRTQEEKLQQLHREKNTLETALLSASQEIEQSSDNPAAVQSLIQQRDVLQNGLLSTCRELARVNTELERSWREYDKMESGVSLAKTNLLEQLEALGSPQTEPPSQQHVHIQKELWRIQDVMEALAKNKPQRTTDTGFLGSKPISNLQKNEPVTLFRSLCSLTEGDRQPPRPPLPQSYGSTERPPAVPPLPSPSGARPPPHTSKHGQRNGTHSSQGPDYRLYKSEPELTTVAEEVDDNNGEDNDKDRLQAGLTTDKEPAATKVPLGVPVYPVGIVPPRTKSPMSPPESCTIASYVTLRKGKKPDPRTERPHSAVEQTCGPGERESGRARMSVEEQLERIRRHQQASLKEKKRSSSSISPSRSPSFSKENPFVTQVRLEVFSTDTQELEAALQDLEEVRGRVTEHLERDRGAELELQRDRAAAAAEEEMERGRAAIEKLERDMTEVAAVVEQEMARTALAVEEELDRAAELELERDRAAVAAAAEELERVRAAAEELVRGRTAVSPEEALDIDMAALVELEMEITVVEEISYRAEEVDVIPVPRLSEEEPQPQTESSSMDTEVSETQVMVISDQGVKPLYVQYLIPGQHQQQGERETERRNTHTPNTLIPHNSLPAAVSEALTPELEEDMMQSEVMQGEAPEHETQGNNINISYELQVEGAKLNNNLMAAQTLSLVSSDS
ncbi:pleckstrin homology domain-containing family A member 6-like isoform X3 [Oncorhynchus keta]|uniref:pleckstrin homology domain-containing family A member 6-like isoform X3 n=1 Tax=Oncorhynchus keta TaxID=8018 RepID=UPI00227BC6B2|nr:pleckstrin homology domain-containing family A member 6-like isoform X3 [Oncorhynchus keta]